MEQCNWITVTVRYFYKILKCRIIFNYYIFGKILCSNVKVTLKNEHDFPLVKNLLKIQVPISPYNQKKPQIQHFQLPLFAMAFHSEWLTSLSHCSINNQTVLRRKTGPQNFTAKSGGSQAYQQFSVDRGIQLPSLHTSPNQETVKSQIQLCSTLDVHDLQKRKFKAHFHIVRLLHYFFRNRQESAFM